MYVCMYACILICSALATGSHMFLFVQLCSQIGSMAETSVYSLTALFLITGLICQVMLLQLTVESPENEKKTSKDEVETESLVEMESGTTVMSSGH